MEFTSLWDGAGDAAQAAADDHALAMAKAACMGFLPFLAGAQSEREYVHREALAEDKITLAAEAAGITTVALAQALKADWDMVAEARAAAAPEPPPFPGSDEPKRVRRLAIVHVAEFPPKDGDDDGKADMDGDGQDDDPAGDVAPQSTGYYVLDEDSNLDIGGPYASKADASDAIDAGVFDADPEGVTVQKGTVAENGGDPDAQQDPDADPQDDGSGDVDPDADTTGAGGNPFAKGAAGSHPDREGGNVFDRELIPSCPNCGSKEVTMPFGNSHVCQNCDHAWRSKTAAQEYRRECPRCGHEWESRTSDTERCPECGAPLDKQGSLTTQANPYTDDNPYTKSDNGPDETSPLAGGADQTDAPGGSMTTKPRQMPSGGTPPTVPGGTNTPQDTGADATGTHIPPGL